MQQIPDANLPQRNRRIFYFTAIFLLLAAIAFVSIQKWYEHAASVAMAKAVTTGETSVNAKQIFQDAGYWMRMSFIGFVLAILSCGIARRRHEAHRWIRVPVIVLLVLYVLLQLLMV